jgi:hypothetical protein
MVTDVTPQEIASRELLTLMKNAQNSDSKSGMGVFIKGSSK